jgi:GNAT superfamily N-acetyltransferase
LLRYDGPLVQMVCEAPVAFADGPEITALTATHQADVLALTALVYPHYFRPRTMALGRYFGIYQEGRLAAMIGERLGTDTTREISAVCTHPDFLGRGYARRLLATLSNDILKRGSLPFRLALHPATATATRRRSGCAIVRRGAD